MDSITGQQKEEKYIVLSIKIIPFQAVIILHIMSSTCKFLITS